MKIVTIDKLKPNDIVVVTWKDNYRTHESFPGTPVRAESFGRVVEVTNEGVILFQNRVLNADEIGAMECMDGQLILGSNVIEIEVLG